jgi:MFS family permease
LFGLVAGPIVDRFNRQRLMVVMDLIRALVTVTIPFLAVTWLPGVFIAVLLVATASAFFNPAKLAIIPSLVPSSLLVRANSLVSSSERTMELLGYSVAGVIAALISWKPLFIVDAATYIFSAVTLLGVVDVTYRAVRKELRILQDVADGLRIIAGSQILRSTMALTSMAALFIGMTYPTLVFLTYGPLHGDAFAYGLLEAGMGAGAIIGALLAPELMSRYKAGTLILAGVFGFGVMYALTGLVQNVWLAGALLGVGGAASTVYYVPLISVTQRESPDRFRGRVMASRFLLAQAGLLGGMAIAGPLSDRLGANMVFVTAGVLLIGASALGFAFRDMREATLRDVAAEPVLKATASG